ncbi:hypothetical protein LSH36_94g03014 [Paralvinella palmiformis]|uniref:Uncharacterized protein n=1 Tax=Paralvinella palmiformis TaxID=53620 RepID=A0AAD9K0V8_9ANNE|nr:hypothetical protein LSH36_94g03014 [Paralvinella palmiformis]
MDTVYCHRKLIYSIVLTFFPLCLAVNWQVSNNAETSLTIVGQSLPNRTQAGTGLEKCPKELQFIDNDRCVKRCPKELPFYNKTDEGYQCLRMCPTGRLYYTVGINECLDVCPQPSRDTCLKTCPPDKPFIGNNEDILANKEEEREEDVMESVDEPLINGGL